LLIFLLVTSCLLSACSLSSVELYVATTTRPILVSYGMVAIGKGNRSIFFKHHRNLQKNIFRNREKLFIILAVALFKDERCEAVPKKRIHI